jgi:ketosteroid isomerase-like protein
MSQENVEIVRAVIDAFNRGDWDSMLKDAAPSMEYDLSHAAGPNRGVYGLDQVRGVVDEFARSWVSARIEPHEFIEAGPHVIVPWTAYFTGRDGIEVHARVAWTFTIRGGEIERVCMYQERQDAIEAAGLPTPPEPAS